MNVLEVIAAELNPANDLDKLTYIANPNNKMKHNLQVTLRIFKHLARGGVIGGIGGAVYSYFSGENYLTSISLGAFAGASTDLLQFLVRDFARETYYDIVRTVGIKNFYNKK